MVQIDLKETGSFLRAALNNPILLFFYHINEMLGKHMKQRHT